MFSRDVAISGTWHSSLFLAGWMLATAVAILALISGAHAVWPMHNLHPCHHIYSFKAQMIRVHFCCHSWILGYRYFTFSDGITPRDRSWVKSNVWVILTTCLFNLFPMADALWWWCNTKMFTNSSHFHMCIYMLLMYQSFSHRPHDQVVKPFFHFSWVHLYSNFVHFSFLTKWMTK